MRGDELVEDELFSYVFFEQRVPVDHPRHGIRKPTDVELASLDGGI
jgi:hypothetical protein